MGQPVTITPDGAPAQSQGPVTITPDSAYETATRSGPYAPAGAAEKAMGEGRTPGEILKDSARAPAIGASVIAPILTGGASLPVQAAVGAASGAAQSKLEGGSNKEAAVSGAIGGALPFVGPVAGRVAKTIGKVAGGVVDDIPVVRQATKLGKYWRETAPPAAEPVNSGAPLPEKPPAEMMQANALSRGASSPPDPAAGLGTIKSGQISQAFKDPGAPFPEDPGTFPGAPNPETPDPQLLKARALFEGSQPATDPAAGLGKIKQSNVAPGQAGQLAESMQKPAPSADVSNGFKRGSLGDLLDQSLGAKKLEPNVPLRKQMPATSSGAISSAADAGASNSDLPAGHTAVKSSALKSYKYDPSAREFEAKATSGNTVYVYGDVAPEDVKAFESADSKGKAWQSIRQNPLVAKIVDGKRIAVKAPQ